MRCFGVFGFIVIGLAIVIFICLWEIKFVFVIFFNIKFCWSLDVFELIKGEYWLGVGGKFVKVVIFVKVRVDIGLLK